MTRRQVLLIAGAAVVTFLAGAVVGRANAAPATRPAAVSGAAVHSASTAVLAGPAEVAEVRSEDGARLAALGYATASQQWLYLSDEELEAAVRAAATPAAADRLAVEVVAEVGVARQALARSPGRVWWLVRPLAWRVVSFTPEAARVSVWTVTVLSAADVAVPQADWVTITVDLAWTDNAWRVEAVAERAGPTPMVGTRDGPWQPEPFDEALDGFARLDGEELTGAGR